MTKFTNIFGWHLYVGGPKETRALELTGIPVDAIDITERVRGFTCSFEIGFGKAGTANAYIELENSDGYFTPHATTYDDPLALYDDPNEPYGGVRVNWFGEPIFIMPLDDTTYPVLPGDPTPRYEGETRPCFAGIVSSVEFTDDGYTSTVVLECEDVFSFLSRYALGSDYTSVDRGLSQIIEELFFVVADREGVPKFGADVYDQTITLVPPPDYVQQDIYWNQGEFLGDIFQRHLVGEYGLVYPPELVYKKVGSTIFLSYGVSSVYSLGGGVYPRERLWPDPDPVPPYTIYTFKDSSATLAPLEHPFKSLQSGVRLENLINQSVATRAGSATTSITTDTGSLNVYGPRVAKFTDTSLLTDGSVSTLTDSLTQWFNTVTYGIEGLEISGGMIETYSKLGDASAYLFKWPNEMLWKLMKVEATGAGGATIDAEVTFFRAELSATPRDWVVRFSGGTTWDQAFGFILNDTDFGVLDENRI